MIAKLTGTIDEAAADTLVIDVGGVGYLVHASSRTIGAVGAVGQLATIFTQMQVSENDQRLVGFASAEERDWYRALTQVQGVGIEGRAGDPLGARTRRFDARGGARRRGDGRARERGRAQAGDADRQ